MQLENKCCDKLFDCVNCLGSIELNHCSSLGSCTFCDNCDSCWYCQNGDFLHNCGHCDNCSYCRLCYFCESCTFCTGLRHAQNCLFCSASLSKKAAVNNKPSWLAFNTKVTPKRFQELEAEVSRAFNFIEHLDEIVLEEKRTEVIETICALPEAKKMTAYIRDIVGSYLDEIKAIYDSFKQ